MKKTLRKAMDIPMYKMLRKTNKRSSKLFLQSTALLRGGVAVVFIGPFSSLFENAACAYLSIASV